MEWHVWYLMSGIVSLVCVMCAMPVAISRAQTARQMVVNIVGLILTLPIVGILIATALFWGIN